ncbi:hypothetical protein HDU79_006487 [Rhizoclosmatium sp. JEL0117]|nr:hypothetical protein HDU79_006487 [Rhizoclosmatium sp. JEL0117]
MFPLTALICATVAGLATASSFCDQTTYSCSIVNDPIVVPFRGSEVHMSNSGYLFQSVEMSVQVKIGGPDALYVNTVVYTCGASTVSYTAASIKGQTVLMCYEGTCVGTDCYVVLNHGNLDLPNIDVTHLVYKGTQGYAGTCYNSDTTCPSSVPAFTPYPVGPKAPQPATVSVPAVQPAGNGFCDVSQFTCSVVTYPVVVPFNGPEFHGRIAGDLYALNSQEMQVQMHFGKYGKYHLLNSVTYTCGAVNQTFTPSAVAKQEILSCNVGACATVDCYVVLALGTSEIDIVQLAYKANHGIGGACYGPDSSCPQPNVPATTVVPPTVPNVVVPANNLPNDVTASTVGSQSTYTATRASATATSVPQQQSASVPAETVLPSSAQEYVAPSPAVPAAVAPSAPTGYIPVGSYNLAVSGGARVSVNAWMFAVVMVLGAFTVM